ncbi:MAG TPA: isochorismatase family cysteine hydrolase [Steroidobacteraceae bacterium]
MQRPRSRHSFNTTALLLLDLISDFRFPAGECLLRAALPAARQIAALKRRARSAGFPTVYVNDNPGKWQSDRQELLQRCLGERSRGRELVQLIAPQIDDYFIFKPRHSGFFETPLESLLHSLHVDRLILTGTTSHQCVLFTAMDAYVRNFQLTVPRDCIAAASVAQTQHALFILRSSLGARTPLAESLGGRRLTNG